MKKSLTAFTYGLSVVLAAGMVFMSSCSKDGDGDPEPEIATLSFEVAELTVNEADGEIEIKLVLDRPAPEAFTAEYDVGGTAREKTVNPLNGVYDYEILDGPTVAGGSGEVEFEKGDDEAVIVLRLMSDFTLESLTTPETINLTIEDVDSDLIEISRDDEIDIALKQEDGTIAILGWGPNDEEFYADVDMDLIFWIKNENGDLQPTNIASAYVSEEPPEFIFFPKVFEDDTYGFSYTYYSGTADPMRFFVMFAEIIDGTEEPEANWVIFEGEYTAANKNGTWDQQGGSLVLAQTFDMEDNVFKNFSELNIEETSSRVRTRKPEGLTRIPVTERTPLPAGIRKR